MLRLPAGAACLAVAAALAGMSAPLRAALAPPSASRPAAATVAGVAQAEAAPATEAALLAVRINEVEQADEVIAVRLSAHALAVPVTAFERWRLRLPAGDRIVVDGMDHLPLDAVPGIRWHIDEPSQTLVIEVPPAAFVANGVEVAGPPRPQQSEAAWGGYLNYDLHWQRDGAGAGTPASRTVGALLEAGVFSPHGNGSHTAVLRETDGRRTLTRLDTRWNIDLPASTSSVRVGDTIGVPGAWGRSVRFGGVQWATDFAVRPGLVSFPMPALRGEAAVPSVVDLYVNDNLQAQGRVPPGPFDLPGVPVVSGAGQVRLVVRDLLGREQVIVQPYYVSPSLLRPGLHDFAFEAGRVRENYGIEGSRYGRALLTATDRVGVTDGFTRELRVELLRDQQSVGAGGLWLVRDLATANLAVAASRSARGAGGLAAAGLDRQGAGWSGGVQGRMASRDFVQLGGGTVPGTVSAPSIRHELSANLAVAVAGGSVAANLVQQAHWEGDRVRVLTLSHGRQLGRLGFLSVFASRTDGSARGTAIGINLVRALGDDVSANAGSYRSRDRAPTGEVRDAVRNTLQVQGAPPVGAGIGYQLQAERGDVDRASGDLAWQTERLAATAGAAQADGRSAVRAGLAGALAVMPEGLFASRRIDSSFAVVRVGDYPGVRVLRDNHVVARTDQAGLAFVPNLRGYETNRISVEGADLPLDAQVDELHVAVAPGRGSGISVRFPVIRTRTAALRLVTVEGTPVPAGSWVRMDGAPREFPVGLDGRLFVAGSGERGELHATWDGRACDASIRLDQGVDDVPELGTVTCR